MGYAAALKKPVIALRTDFRMNGSHERVNLMLEQASRVVTNKNGLLESLGCSLVHAHQPEKKST
jgi:nucleoside 2-deoxyribosyltransferase